MIFVCTSSEKIHTLILDNKAKHWTSRKIIYKLGSKYVDYTMNSNKQIPSWHHHTWHNTSYFTNKIQLFLWIEYLVFLHSSSSSPRICLYQLSILRRELRDVLLYFWPNPRITRTITSRIWRVCTIRSISFSLSTTILKRCWSLLYSSTCKIHSIRNLLYSRFYHLHAK